MSRTSLESLNYPYTGNPNFILGLLLTSGDHSIPSFQASYLSKLEGVGSTVSLRFRKSIAGHHFQNTRKLANNDFQYHRDIIYSVYQFILTKKIVFASCKKFYID